MVGLLANIQNHLRITSARFGREAGMAIAALERISRSGRRTGEFSSRQYLEGRGALHSRICRSN